MTDTKPGISRRTLAKGAAWSVPAAAVVAAAPAYAKSGGGPSIQVLSACKQPGASCEKDYGFLKGYTFLVRISNPTSQPIYIYTSSTPPPAPNQALVPYFQVSSSVPFSYNSARLFTPPSTIGAALAPSQLIPANGSLLVIINAGTNSNSANTDAIGSLWFPWGHSSTIGGDTDHSYTPSPVNSNSPGEGWRGGSFSFASTPPCDNCFPSATATSSTSTSTTTAAVNNARQTSTETTSASPQSQPKPTAEAAPAESAATTVAESPVTAETTTATTETPPDAAAVGADTAPAES